MYAKLVIGLLQTFLRKQRIGKTVAVQFFVVVGKLHKQLKLLWVGKYLAASRILTYF